MGGGGGGGGGLLSRKISITLGAFSVDRSNFLVRMHSLGRPNSLTSQPLAY